MSNRLFSRFVAAKPEGRKTALGNFIFFPFSKFGLKIILSTNICTHGANNTYLYSFSEIECCCKQPCDNYEHNPASSLSSQDTFWTSSYWGWYFCLLTSVYFPALSGGDRGLLQHPPGPHPDNQPTHSKDCPHDTLHLALWYNDRYPVSCIKYPQSRYTCI